MSPRSQAFQTLEKEKERHDTEMTSGQCQARETPEPAGSGPRGISKSNNGIALSNQKKRLACFSHVSS